MTTTDHTNNRLDEKLSYLKLSYMLENYESLAKKAAQKHWTHVNYLTELATAEANLRADRATKRRIRAARFAQIKTLEQFKWSWPKKINQLQVKNLFRLSFVEQKSNVIFLGGVGLGKTHLATALGYHACLKGHTVLFCSAVDAINSLAAAQSAGRLKQELRKYHKPALVILDELGYLPIDKTGADLLFQIIQAGEMVKEVFDPFIDPFLCQVKGLLLAGDPLSDQLGAFFSGFVTLFDDPL